MGDGVTLDVPSVSSLLFTSLLLYFFASFNFGPVQMTSVQVFTSSGDKSSGGGVFPGAGSAKWLPYTTDQMWALWVRTFVYVKLLFNCFNFFAPLVQRFAAKGVST
jgi:hypothetical protein